jgi:hypothetical protein
MGLRGASPGSAAPWVSPPGHRLHVFDLALDLDLSRGYDWAQMCHEGGLLH